MRKDYLYALPPLRLIASLFIVVFHLYRYGFLKVDHLYIQHVLTKGYVGTALFFVISGFILMHLYAYTSRFRPSAFYWKRLTRLAPPYLLGLALALPITLLGSHRAALDHPLEVLGQLALYLSALQAWVYGQAFLFDGPAWSVSVLVTFYLLFPFICTRLLRLSTKSLYGVAAALWALDLGPPTVLMTRFHINMDGDSPVLGYIQTFPLFRLPDLMLGMVAAVLYQRRVGQSWLGWRFTPALALAALLAIMALVPEPNHWYPLFHNGLLTPLIMVLLTGLAYHRGLLARLGQRPWVQRLGDTTLNIFLLHVPLFAYYKVLLPGRPSVWSGVQIAVYLVILLLLSVLTEQFVTAPLMRRARQRVNAGGGSTPGHTGSVQPK